jgi:hypothetical protein
MSNSAHDSSDKFCNAVIRDAVGIDPENQEQTKSAGIASANLSSCIVLICHSVNGDL